MFPNVQIRWRERQWSGHLDNLSNDSNNFQESSGKSPSLTSKKTGQSLPLPAATVRVFFFFCLFLTESDEILHNDCLQEVVLDRSEVVSVSGNSLCWSGR